MFKQTQYLAVDLAKPQTNQTSYERISSNIVDNPRFRQREVSIANLENCSNQRFNQIKRKYGMQDKSILEPAEIKPLREINLKTSNSYIFKDKQQNFKLRSATVCKSTFFNPIHMKQNPKPSFRQSIVRKVDQQRDIPRFGGRTNWEGITSKSIQIPHGQRLGSINNITMKIHQALNMNMDNKKLKQDFEQNMMRSQKSDHDIVTSKIYFQNQQNNNSIIHELRQNRRVQSIDDKMKRCSVNFSDLQQNKRSRTPHLLEQSKREDSSRHRNFDDQIRRIEQRIKKSNEQKKRLDIILPQRQSFQLPKRVLDYTKQQKPLTFMERRNRIMSSNLSSMKLKTQECQKFNDLSMTKQSNRLNTEYSKFDLPNQKYDGFKYQNYQKQSTTHRSFDEKTQLNKLVQSLKIQVQLDQKLRNAKVTSSSNHVQNKWSIIKQQLQKQKIFFAESKVQSQFQISQQQHNPFFSVRQSNKSFDQVIKRYCQSYKHWTANVFQKFNLISLTKQGFCEKKIDLTKKGQISIEDLVRFLNFQTKNFYRNRDLFLIWRRITTKSSLQFQELTNNICHK